MGGGICCFKREGLEEASLNKQFHDPMRKNMTKDIHHYREKEACAYQWKCCHLEGRQVAIWQDDWHCSELAVEHESDFRAPTWPNTMGIIGYTGLFPQKNPTTYRRVHHLQNTFQTSMQQ